MIGEVNTRILIADPNRDVLDGLAESLERVGFTVQCARDKQTCVRLLNEFAPDAWVLEPDVKGNWGWKLLVEMADRRPPTVIVSRFAERTLGSSLYETWLVKPVNAVHLAAEIREATGT